MTNNKCAIFCTCAETNQKYYISRIEKWYAMLKDIPDTDLFCCVDGNIIEDIPAYLREKIHFIELCPSLGRSSVLKFEGFKRSFGFMMDYLKGYEFVSHVESDIKIINIDKFKKYQITPGLFSAICEKYGFLESAFLILNDKNYRQFLFERYSQKVNIEENNIFEVILQQSGHFNFAFSSTRKEGDNNLNESKYDVIAQTY